MELVDGIVVLVINGLNSLDAVWLRSTKRLDHCYWFVDGIASCSRDLDWVLKHAPKGGALLSCDL